MFKFVIRVSNKNKQVDYGLYVNNGDELGQVVLAATDYGGVTIERAVDRRDYVGRFHSFGNLITEIVLEFR